MSASPYGDIVGQLAKRLRGETRSAADVEQLIDEIDWYRLMVRDEINNVERSDGLLRQEKRSKLAKLERNDDGLADLRMKAMDLKKEREKLDADYEEVKAQRERAVQQRDTMIAKGKETLRGLSEAADAEGISEAERKTRKEAERKARAEYDKEQREINAAMEKLRNRMNRWS